MFLSLMWSIRQFVIMAQLLGSEFLPFCLFPFLPLLLEHFLKSFLVIAMISCWLLFDFTLGHHASSRCPTASSQIWLFACPGQRLLRHCFKFAIINISIFLCLPRKILALSSSNAGQKVSAPLCSTLDGGLNLGSVSQQLAPLVRSFIGTRATVTAPMSRSVIKIQWWQWAPETQKRSLKKQRLLDV